MADVEFRTFGSIVISIALVVLFGFLGAVGLVNACRSHSPLWGPMPTRRFVRFFLASGLYGLVFVLLLDGVKWMERRSWLLGQLAIGGLAVLYAVQGARIRRGMRWLSFGASAPPEAPAS